MRRPSGLTDAQWVELQANTEAQRMELRWWVREGALVETRRAPLTDAEKSALDAWWLERRGAPTAQQVQHARLSALATEGIQSTRQITTYPSEPPRLEAVCPDVWRITLDCFRAGCDGGEVEVKYDGRPGEYTFRTTCPRCSTAYRPGEEATAVLLAKTFFENYEPSESQLVAYYASGDEPGEVHDRQAHLLATAKR